MELPDPVLALISLSADLEPHVLSYCKKRREKDPAWEPKPGDKMIESFLETLKQEMVVEDVEQEIKELAQELKLTGY